MGICPKILCSPRDVKIDWVHSEGVFEIVPMQECKDAGMNPLDLIWTSLWIRHARKFDRGCVQENTKRRRKVIFNELYPLLNCSLQCHLSKLLKLRHYDISRAHFKGTGQRLIYIKLPAEDRQKYGEDKVGRLIKSMYGTQDASHIWQLNCVNLTCGKLGGFRRGKHSAALFHHPNQDVRMAVHGDNF